MTVARATPIDRTELVRVLEEAFRVAGAIWGYDSEVIADRVLALIQPTQGIVLTPWQAAIAQEACRNSLSEFEGAWPEQHLARYRALADHLEAAALNT